jgi:hypothetical protein
MISNTLLMVFYLKYCDALANNIIICELEYVGRLQQNICFYFHKMEFSDLAIVPVIFPSASLECEKCLCARYQLGLRTDLSTKILHDSNLFHAKLPITKRDVPLSYMILV